MALPIRKLIVRLRMFWADIRGHHGMRWNYEPGDHYMRGNKNKEEHNHPKTPYFPTFLDA